jgi:hypothetical protein
MGRSSHLADIIFLGMCLCLQTDPARERGRDLANECYKLSMIYVCCLGDNSKRRASSIADPAEPYPHPSTTQLDVPSATWPSITTYTHT